MTQQNDASCEVVGLADIEAETRDLMQQAARHDGMSISAWIGARMKDAAERSLSLPHLAQPNHAGASREEIDPVVARQIAEWEADVDTIRGSDLETRKRRLARYLQGFGGAYSWTRCTPSGDLKAILALSLSPTPHASREEVAGLERFADDVQDVHSRIIIVHQLRASADIQDDATKRETGWATTSDRARLMREAADLIERLIAALSLSRPTDQMGEGRPLKLMMPNGETLECEYPNSSDWAKSWSIRYPDTNQIGTTGEQDWELVERYGLTAILDAALSISNPPTPEQAGGEVAMREALERIVAHDDLEIDDPALEQHDRQSGWAKAMRLCGDIARAALPIESAKSAHAEGSDQ